MHHWFLPLAFTDQLIPFWIKDHREISNWPILRVIFQNSEDVVPQLEEFCNRWYEDGQNLPITIQISTKFLDLTSLYLRYFNILKD